MRRPRGIVLLAGALVGAPSAWSHTEGTEVADPSSRPALLTLQTATAGYKALEAREPGAWPARADDPTDTRVQPESGPAAAGPEGHQGHHES